MSDCRRPAAHCQWPQPPPRALSASALASAHLHVSTTRGVGSTAQHDKMQGVGFARPGAAVAWVKGLPRAGARHRCDGASGSLRLSVRLR